MTPNIKLGACITPALNDAFGAPAALVLETVGAVTPDDLDKPCNCAQNLSSGEYSDILANENVFYTHTRTHKTHNIYIFT